MSFIKTPLLLCFCFVFLALLGPECKSESKPNTSQQIKSKDGNILLQRKKDIKIKKQNNDKVNIKKTEELTAPDLDNEFNLFKSPINENTNKAENYERLKKENSLLLKQFSYMKLFFYFLVGIYLTSILAIIIIINRDNVNREIKLLKKLNKDHNLSESAKSSPRLKKSQPIYENEPKSFSNISNASQEISQKDKGWLVVAATSIGKSHIAGGKPCQDNHYCENLGSGWGIAIVCDGAGSEENSHQGSEFVAKNSAMKIFKKIITQNGWVKNNHLPSESNWSSIANEGFKQIYKDLEIFAESKQIGFSSLACTIIVIIYSPIGIVVSHIGDGRAGFCNERGEWKSVIIPHKGEEANQTIFITSKTWINEPNFVMSGVPVPENRIIKEQPIAFTLMTDGCETHSFECSKMDAETNRWTDPNTPYLKFFNPLVAHLKELHSEDNSLDSINKQWEEFIEEGTIGLKEETDDKTLILGIWI